MQPRRRLEVPPVKAACLACRASKARCNGENPCNRCGANGKACQYLPSRRGRVVRAPVTPPSTGNSTGSPASIEGLNCDVPNKRPKVSIDYQGALLSHSQGDSRNVRVHGSNQSILDAYYLLIHPDLPILPPPTTTLDQLQAQTAQEGDCLNSESPLLHAIATLVALVPKNAEYGYSSMDARSARNDYAEQCSRSALRCIDSDMDTSGPLTRSRFHQDVPVNLESTIANLLVAMYEYNYRGAMMRARTRTASVITMAVDLGLHDVGSGSPLDSECKKRTWAMILFFANKLSIIHHLPPLMAIGDPRFKTSPPLLAVSPDIWTPILRSQDILLTSQAKLPTSTELEALDATISSYSQDLDRPLAGGESIDSEGLAARKWWAIARIVVHSARIRLRRLSAFADIPAFVNKHCDMTALQDAKHFPVPTTNCHELPSPESLADSPKTDDWATTEVTGPFSANESAEICLKSAFVVLRMFRYLTEVLAERHLQLPGLHNANRDERKGILASVPTIMPLMACSAMQACYVMVMTLYKVKFALVVDQPSGEDQAAPSTLDFLETERLVEELRHGVKDSLHMLERYQTGFAHIKDMYEELEMVYQVAFVDV
ncbi:hypothetical protein C7974DRAFT_211855 [Boeremia exigua]|uniref:uncharacterized protein n=1 Tax=Boeremia exigua TaxID=749465 RepID=UPI001E8CF21E|nr:uncharacterized protein C7974DRAFT_211855 [Boeremia exigua]KAH6621835.1 hypothetical protein C7974DRAFT_211855 [Boeremia exigua]